MHDRACYENEIVLRDSTVYLVGSGESVTDIKDYSFLDGQITMGLNSGVHLLKNPCYLGWSDFTWQLENTGTFRRYRNAELINFLVNPLTNRIDGIVDKSLYHKIKVESMTGFNTTMPNVNGNNTGTRALNFLAHFKPYNIILIGFDLQGGNWHRQYKPTQQKHHDSFLQNFEDMAPHLKEMGINVYNAASPERSRLKCFEFIDLKEMFNVS